MKNMVFVIFSALLLLPYTNAFSEKGFFIFGQVDCGNFLANCDRDKNDWYCVASTTWVLGFISGRTWESSTPRRDVSFDSMKYALMKYCRENPLKDTHNAAQSIYRELIK